MAESSPSPGRALGGAVPARALRVLVADDDRDAARTLALILEDEGYEAHVVYDGAAVIPELGRFEPDVALLDIGMPGYSGYELARYVRRRYGDESGIVLIAVTGWSKPSERILAKLAGFDHHFPKPVNIAQLLDVLRACRPLGTAPSAGGP